jgi:hypothetical protein
MTFWYGKNSGNATKKIDLLKLRQDVHKYIIYCTFYVISKHSIKKQGIYTPIPTPYRPWESISMYYMSSLPSTKHGDEFVYMVIDRFSKIAVLAPYKKRITIEATTKIFFEHVWVHFGLAITQFVLGSKGQVEEMKTDKTETILPLSP